MKQSSRAWFQAAMSTSRVLPGWTACSPGAGHAPSSAAELSGPPGSCPLALRPDLAIGLPLSEEGFDGLSQKCASGPARTTSAMFLKRNEIVFSRVDGRSSKRQIHDRQHSSGDTLVTSLDKSPADLRD